MVGYLLKNKQLVNKMTRTQFSSMLSQKMPGYNTRPLREKELDEEEVIFDHQQLLPRKNRQTLEKKKVKRRRLKTIALSMAFFCLGLCVALPGPTLLELGRRVNRDVEHMTFIFTARSLGFLIGSLVGGVLFDFFDQQILLVYTLSMAMAATASIPWCTALVTLSAFICMQGVAIGVLQTGGNVFCIKIWGKKSAPFMQVLHFCFGIGAFLAPLIVRPFLIDPVLLDNTTKGNHQLVGLSLLAPLSDVSWNRQTRDLSNFYIRGYYPPYVELTNESDLANTWTWPLDTKQDVSNGTFSNFVIPDWKNLQVPLSERNSPGFFVLRIKRDSAFGSNNNTRIENNTTKVDIETTSTVPTTTKAIPTTEKPKKPTFNSGDKLDDKHADGVANEEKFKSIIKSVLEKDKSNSNNIVTTTTGVWSPSNTTVANPRNTTYYNASFVDTKNYSSSEEWNMPPSSTSGSTPILSSETTTAADVGLSTVPRNTSLLASTTITNGEVETTHEATTTKSTTTTTPTTITASSIAINTPTRTTSSSTQPTVSPTLNLTLSALINTSPAVLERLTAPALEKLTVPALERVTAPSVLETVTINSLENRTTATKPETTGDIFRSVVERLTRLSRIHVAYSIVGFLLALNASLFLFLHCKDHSVRPSIQMTRQRDMIRNSFTRSFVVSIILLLFLFFLAYMAMEVTVGGLLATFAVYNSAEHLTQSQGALLTAIFWGCLALGRGVAIFIARCVRPSNMMVMNLSLTVLGAMILSFGVPVNPAVLWVGTVTLGLGMSSLFPTAISWADSFYPLSERATAVFVAGCGVGEMTIPLLTGYLYENVSHMAVMFVTLILSFVLSAVYFGVQFLLCCNGRSASFPDDSGFSELRNIEDSDENEVEVAEGFSLGIAENVWRRRVQGEE